MDRRDSHDPYAPPPMHHDRSGAIVRIAVVAVILAGAVWGYSEFSGREQPAQVAAQEQQLADAGVPTAPVTDTAAPETAPATPAPQQRPTAATAEPPAAEPSPPPASTSPPPAPLPPLAAPPSG